jgi:hypothetical protein
MQQENSPSTLQDLEKTQHVGIFREERLALWNSFGIFGVPFHSSALGKVTHLQHLHHCWVKPFQ